MKKLQALFAMLVFVAAIACAYAISTENPADGAIDARLYTTDEYDYVYLFKAGGGGRLSGGVQTTGCGIGRIDQGNYWKIRDTLYGFHAHVALFDPNCCPGYTMDGQWDTSTMTGYYDWVNDPPCSGGGSTTMWRYYPAGGGGGTPAVGVRPGCDLVAQF